MSGCPADMSGIHAPATDGRCLNCDEPIRSQITRRGNADTDPGVPASMHGGRGAREDEGAIAALRADMLADLAARVAENRREALVRHAMMREAGK